MERGFPITSALLPNCIEADEHADPSRDPFGQRGQGRTLSPHRRDQPAPVVALLAQPLPVQERPFEHLGQTVDLVVVASVGKGAQFGQECVEAIKACRQPDAAFLDLAGLGKQALGLVLLAAAKVEKARLDEERRRKQEEARLLREERERLEFIESRRKEALGVLVGELGELDALRRISVHRHADGHTDRHDRVSAFSSWLLDRLEKMEARLSRDGLETRFKEQQLFGSTDDHGFHTRRRF